MSFSNNIFVNGFNLSSICVDHIQFLIRINFEDEHSTSKFVKGIIRHNLNVMYTYIWKKH